MSDISVLVLQFQLRSLYLQQLIQAESAKEYKADWLKNTDTVIRDGTGKFAKKGTSIAQSVQDTTAILKQGFDLTTDTIQSLIKDLEFRKRAGLAAGLPMAKLISDLATQARLNPKLTEKLDEWIANATKEFADQYGDDKSPMAQAIRNSKLTQPPKDASFNEKMEFRVAQFAAYKEALESPEDYSKRDELIGKAATAAIPIGISLAIALGFEVAIPLFMAQGVNWATVLSSVAIGEAADFAVQKGMDKFEINNPALRIGASMVAGILAGGLVTGVNNKIKNTQKLTKESERLAKEKSERLAQWEAERVAKAESERLAREQELHRFKQIKEAIQSRSEGDRLIKKAEELKHYGFEYLAKKEYEKALILLNKSHDVDPDADGALKSKARVLNKLGKHEEAIGIIDGVIQNEGKHSGAAGILGVKGESLHQLGRHEEALRSFDEALKLDTRNPGLLIGKSNTLSQMGYFNEALSLLRDIYDVENNLDAMDAMANVLIRLEKSDEAIKMLDRFMSKFDYDSRGYDSKGRLLFELGDFKGAIDLFDKALSLNPGNLKILTKKAEALGELKKYKEALLLVDKFATEEIPEAWNYKGWLLKKMGRKQDAIKAYEKALEIDPGNETYKINRDNLISN